jgi:hypothetical protein
VATYHLWSQGTSLVGKLERVLGTSTLTSCRANGMLAWWAWKGIGGSSDSLPAVARVGLIDGVAREQGTEVTHIL